MFPSMCVCPCLCASLRRAWQPTPVFLPGESHGQGSLAGCSPWGHKEADRTEATEQASSMCLRPSVSPTPVCPDGAGGVLCLCVSKLVMTTYFPLVSMHLEMGGCRGDLSKGDVQERVRRRHHLLPWPQVGLGPFFPAPSNPWGLPGGPTADPRERRRERWVHRPPSQVLGRSDHRRG